jgi:hypothetical protein
MEPNLGSRYVKMCRKRKKTHVAYKDKLGKQPKLLSDHNFQLELRFEKTNSCWKGIEEEKTYIHPKF